jgi:hypothetical protein
MTTSGQLQELTNTFDKIEEEGGQLLRVRL